MKFGIFYEHSVSKPWSEVSEWRAYHQALEQICLADELGFDQVWEVEHHFLEEYSHSSAPEVFLSAAAAQTKNINVCQGIALCLPQINHPARIAERAAALDIISNGRLQFGTGRSATWTELGGFQVEPDDTKEMWDEVIRAIPRMWREESFEWNGKYFQMPARNVLPKPVQKPHPPMWVAVSSPETAIQAAERGLGLLGVSIGTPEEYEQRIRDYRRIIQDCEPVGEFVNNQVNAVGWMYTGESQEEAEQVGGAGAMAFAASAAHLAGVGAIYPSPSYGAQASAIQLRNRPGDVNSAGAGQGRPIGTPDRVVEALRSWEAIGVDRMVFLINFDQVIPHKKVMASLERFAKEVMPAFEEPEKPSLTTLPDFDSVADDFVHRERAAVAAGGSA
jgi:alkanesulfonate monooxygenase SsuD/methylene tetrahydromethanopterin reductase-like flavin-dependent oxidoreductase (luciferase family)